MRRWLLLVVAIACALHVTCARAADYWFDARSYSYGVGANPQDIAIADFDGDGRNDVATASPASARVTVVFGEADGSLGRPRFIAFADMHPQYLRVADFDGDGRPDLVATGTDATRVLLGNGDGTFRPTPQPNPSGGYGVVTTDFDHDGRVDFALFLGTTIQLYRGLGDGTVASGPSIGTAPANNPAWFGVGDVDADGWPDFIVTSAPGQRLNPIGACLRNDHAGGFISTSVQGIGPPAVGDATGDGIPDVVTVYSYLVMIAPGRGDGTFDAVNLHALPNNDGSLDAVKLVDIDGGSHLEIVASDQQARVWVVQGFVEGGVFLPVAYHVPSNPTGFAFGDVDADGIPDLVVPDPTPGTVTVLPGRGDGTFGGGRSTRTGYPPWAMTAADLDGDGLPDLAAVINARLVVLRGLGDGTYSIGDSLGFDPTEIAGGGQVAVADVDRDGRPDIVCTRTYANLPTYDDKLLVFLGHGDGHFDAPILSSTATGPNAVTVRDLDGDGRPDAIVSSHGSGLSIMRGYGNGSFVPVADLGGLPVARVAIGDFNEDGLLDFAAPSLYVPSTYGAALQLFLATAPAEFAPGSQVSASQNVRDVATADFDGDGHLDLVWGEGTSAGACVRIAHGDGHGAFHPAVCQGTLAGIGRIDVADMNADGWPDVILDTTAELGVWLGTPGGTLGELRLFGTSTWEVRAITDFDGDGMPDVVGMGQTPPLNAEIIGMRNLMQRVNTPTLLERFDARAVAGGVELTVAFATPPAGLAFERAASEAGPWTAVAATPHTDGATTTLLDTDVAAGATCWYRVRVRDAAGATQVFGPLAVVASPAAVRATLAAVTPNPARDPVTIGLGLAVAARVRLTIADVTGRTVAVLANGELPAGAHALSWSAARAAAPPGLYWARLEAAGHVVTRRFAFVR